MEANKTEWGNCYTHAFGLVKRDVISEPTGAQIKACIVDGFLEKQQLTNPEEGCLILYFKDECPQHASIFLGNGLVSTKWGEQPSKKCSLECDRDKYPYEQRFYVRPKSDVSVRHLKGNLSDEDLRTKYFS